MAFLDSWSGYIGTQKTARYCHLLVDYPYKAPETPQVVQGFSRQGSSLLQKTANHCSCQGNARAAESSGMTPSVDGAPGASCLMED